MAAAALHPTQHLEGVFEREGDGRRRSTRCEITFEIGEAAVGFGTGEFAAVGSTVRNGGKHPRGAVHGWEHPSGAKLFGEEKRRLECQLPLHW